MSDQPTPLQSLEVLTKVVEAAPCTGPERDALRWHAQNIGKALQPLPATGPEVPPENGRSHE